MDEADINEALVLFTIKRGKIIDSWTAQEGNDVNKLQKLLNYFRNLLRH